MSATIAISKRKIREADGVVVLPVAEYRRLVERSVPTYYLAGKKAETVDKLVEEGPREYREGRTRKITSLAEYNALRGRAPRSEFVPTAAQKRALARAENNFRRGRTLTYGEFSKALGGAR
ncbi:MAG: hypothetical protein Q8R39_04705 [bacterium]|nr:hypothetical protein [bacterium]MDZ4285033.1 hypothetical protein [Patescibacteria group bacterium]